MKNHHISRVPVSFLKKAVVAIVVLVAALALSNPTFAGKIEWYEIESVYDGSGADARDYRYRGSTFNAAINASARTGWHTGGTLHRSSIPDWNSASYQNQMATAADWAVELNAPLRQLLGWTKDPRVAKEPLMNLLVCINISANDTPDLRLDGGAGVLAATCAALIGWSS